MVTFLSKELNRYSNVYGNPEPEGHRALHGAVMGELLQQSADGSRPVEEHGARRPEHFSEPDKGRDDGRIGSEPACRILRQTVCYL